MPISAKELADRWQLTQRRITQLFWRQSEAYRQYQGKYPVIYISFKDTRYKSWEDMYQALRYAIKKELVFFQLPIGQTPAPTAWWESFYRKGTDGSRENLKVCCAREHSVAH